MAGKLLRKKCIVSVAVHLDFDIPRKLMEYELGRFLGQYCMEALHIFLPSFLFRDINLVA